MKAGDTFLLQLADEHLWVVISDPSLNPQRVLVVNFTTWRQYHDQACILDRGDHPFVRHRTCVNYPSARVATDADLEEVRAAGLLHLHDPLSDSLLQRIRAAVRASRMKLEHVQVLVDQGLIE
jgi:hypothetical protein